MEQTFRDLDPTLQSAGERLDQIARAIAQIELEQEMIDPLAERRPGKAVEMALMFEILAHPQFLVEARRLENDADPAAQRAGVAEQIEPQNGGRAAAWPNERRQNAEKRGLAAAVRSEQAKDLARRDAKRDVIEREAIAVAMSQLVSDECGRDSLDRGHDARR